MKPRNLNELGRDAATLKRRIIESADDTKDWAKEAVHVVEDLEAELEKAWQENEIKEDDIGLLEEDNQKLKSLIESHWCICPKCGEGHTHQ